MLGLTAGAAVADVVAVVSSKSAITTLSKTQIADIFMGRVSHFPGGETATAIDQEEGSPARDEFYQALIGKSAPQLKAYWSKIIFTGRGQPPRTVADGVEMKRFIAMNPTAIGYLDEKFVDASLRALR